MQGHTTRGLWARRSVLGLAGAAGAGLWLAGCGRGPRRQPAAQPSGSSGGAPARTGAVPATPQTPATAAAPTDFLYLTILTGRMVGRQGWPLFVPANFRVPARALVQAEIRCYDDAAAPVTAGGATVTGTVGGTMTVLPLASPAGAGGATGRTAQSWNPADIAHTFTVSNLSLNVPVPPRSIVRFALRTPGPGQYPWQCMAACGTGSNGWMGTMQTKGWMRGTMTVV